MRTARAARLYVFFIQPIKFSVLRRLSLPLSLLKTSLTFRYSELRLIDIGSLKDSFPLTITDLKKNVFKATQQGVKTLQEMWIPSCVKLISDRRDEIEVCMPDVEVIAVKPEGALCSNVFLV